MKDHTEKFVPKNLEELSTLVGKPVSLFSWTDDRIYFYFGATAEGYQEFILQQRRFSPELKKFTMTQNILACNIPSNDLTFRDTELVCLDTDRYLTKAYSPLNQEYDVRLKMLQRNNAWQKIPVEVTH